MGISYSLNDSETGSRTPIWFEFASVSHSLPVLLVVISEGALEGVGILCSEKVPLAGGNLPILLRFDSINQMLSVLSIATLVGKVYAVGILKDWKVSAPHEGKHSKLPKVIQRVAAIFTALSLSKY